LLPEALGLLGLSTAWSRRRVAYLLTGLSILFFGLGVYLLLSMWRSKIVLMEDRIEIHELTRVRSLQKKEIRGWRLVPTGYMAVLELVPPDPQARKLKVAWLFKDDEAFSAWMDDVPNLDAEEQEKAWNEATNDPEIGPSPQDRVEAIGKARGTCRILSGIAIGIAIWGFVYPYPYRLLMIILVAMPRLAWRNRTRNAMYTLPFCRSCPNSDICMATRVSPICCAGSGYRNSERVRSSGHRYRRLRSGRQILGEMEEQADESTPTGHAKGKSNSCRETATDIRGYR
jgi:hypothetical protein